MIHSFDTEDASKYGILEASILYNIRFWIAKNEANNKHFHQGRYWTYNSAKAFAKLFTYASQQQIQRALKRLEVSGAILVGNFNENPYDHTKWYGLSEASTMINRLIKSDQPSNSTYINTDVRQDACPHQDILAVWKEIVPDLPQPRGWTAARQKLLRSRWQEDDKRQNLDWWRKFFSYLSNSSFLMGKVASLNRKPFEMSLDWLLKEDNFVKCLEGKYHAKDEQ